MVSMVEAMALTVLIRHTSRVRSPCQHNSNYSRLHINMAHLPQVGPVRNEPNHFLHTSAWLVVFLFGCAP